MMSESDFDARLTHIEEQAEEKQARVDGYRDQHMARLFLESGWSQQELADHLTKRWGKTVEQRWVSYRLRFGRFVSFFRTSGSEEWKIPANLTERRFRELWDATTASGEFSGHKAHTEAAKEDEQRRFGEVLAELKTVGLRRHPKPIRKTIIMKLAGKSGWLTVEEIIRLIAGEFDAPILHRDVQECLTGWQPRKEAPYRVERAGEKGSYRYRLVKIKGHILDRKQFGKWSHELIPLMEDLIREARKDRVEISTTHLCATASAIQKVLEQITSEVPAE